MGAGSSINPSQEIDAVQELEQAVELASQFITANPDKADELFARAKTLAKQRQQQQAPSAAQQENLEPSSAAAITITLTAAQQDFAENVLVELNKVRCNPAEYAKWVTATILPQFHLDSPEPLIRHMSSDNETPDMITKEGAAAVNELLQVLKQTPAMQPLSLSHPLHCAAREHVLDIGPSGVVSHTGTDGSSPTDRTERFGSWLGSVGENISFGHDDPAEVVLQFLVDDNVPSRGHRTAVLNPDFRVVGMWLGSHTKYTHCSTVVLAGGMGPKLIDLNEHVHVVASSLDDVQLGRVLGAIQHDNPMKKKIEDALAEGQTVDVDYKPGEITLKIANMRFTSKWGAK